MPATMLCAVSLPRAGQRAPLTHATSARTSAAIPNRALRNVNGSASARAYLPTTKPSDHSQAKVSGVARMKN